MCPTDEEIRHDSSVSQDLETHKERRNYSCDHSAYTIESSINRLNIGIDYISIKHDGT